MTAGVFVFLTWGVVYQYQHSDQSVESHGCVSKQQLCRPPRRSCTFIPHAEEILISTINLPLYNTAWDVHMCTFSRSYISFKASAIFWGNCNVASFQQTLFCHFKKTPNTVTKYLITNSNFSELIFTRYCHLPRPPNLQRVTIHLFN